MGYLHVCDEGGDASNKIVFLRQEHKQSARQGPNETQVTPLAHI